MRKHFIPAYGLQVSVLLDSNGANTTAAAAVRAASKHLELGRAKALVLGGTGPVGLRVARLLAGCGASVRIGSRLIDRAERACRTIRSKFAAARVEAVSVADAGDGPRAIGGCDLVIAAGAPGVILLPKRLRSAATSLRVMIDLNAVPPGGIEGIEVTDAVAERDGVIAYGAIGVGNLKMKVHKAAVAELFTANDRVLDAEEIYEISGRF